VRAAPRVFAPELPATELVISVRPYIPKPYRATTQRGGGNDIGESTARLIQVFEPPRTTPHSGGKSRLAELVKTNMIDETRAKFESDLVRENLALVQYVTSEIAHRVPSHVNRGDLVRGF